MTALLLAAFLVVVYCMWDTNFACLIFASIGFIGFNLSGIIDGSSSWRELIGDLRFLWGPGSDGKIFYGLEFDDD